MSEKPSAPAARPFIHLRCPTEYSLSHSSLSVKDMVKGVGMLSGFGKKGAIALTDDHAMFGMIRMAEECGKNGVKPVYGVNLRVRDETLPEYARDFEILALIKNREGFLRLSELLSENYAEDVPDGTVRRIDAAKLSAPGANANLILLSGAQNGDVGLLLARNEWDLARERARMWSESCLPGEYVLELQRYGDKRSLSYNITNKSLKLAVDNDLPVVATHPIEFFAPSDYTLNNLVCAIHENTTILAMEESGRYSPDQYFKSGTEMEALFADVPSAIDNTRRIAAKCNYTIEIGKSYLPRFKETEGLSEADFLRVAAERGLKKRLAQIRTSRSYSPDTFDESVYWERLNKEIGVIQDMGFPGYFLIVSDFIRWAKNNRCPVGPGRGSGAGSLVAYALEITSLDPIPNGLLFERFLNPERVSMPDFDVDFCRDNRNRVIDYVRDTYGHNAVSQISTFLTMKSKSAVKDVARAMGLPFQVSDTLTKNMPGTDAAPVPVAEAFYETDENGKVKGTRLNEKMAGLAEHLDKAFLKSSPYKVADVVRYAARMEKQVKAVGMHAGGVVIAPGRISDFSPLYRSEGEDGRMVSMFDKNDIEKAGLVKFDFLGLKNMTVLQFAEDELKRTGVPTHYVHEPVDFDDPGVYEILSDGNTTGVFQVESPKMKQWLRKLKPSDFEAITAMLALYRPGPINSGMLSDYVERKRACDEDPELDRVTAGYFPHPDLAPVLDQTYGVMVYQEQVMAAGQIIGGYTLGGADILRRAMGKKKADEMARQRDIFLAGAAEKGYDAEMAASIFSLMEKFADYGFNKSHSAAYAVITYQTAFLKYHHPEIFYAASLSQEYADTDHIKTFLDDALMNGVRIEAPDINSGTYHFHAVFDDGPTPYVRFGLGALKGINKDTVDAIVAEREVRGPFASFEDFVLRMPKENANKRVLESLVKSGAFDLAGDARARSAMIAAIPVMRKKAEYAAKCATYLAKKEAYEAKLDAIAKGAKMRKPAPPRPPKEPVFDNETAVYFDDPFTLAEYEFASFGFIRSARVGPLLRDCCCCQDTTLAGMHGTFDRKVNVIGFKTDYFEGRFIDSEGKPVERGRLSFTDGSGPAGAVNCSIRSDYDTDGTIRAGLRLIKDRAPIIAVDAVIAADTFAMENVPSAVIESGLAPRLKMMVRPRKFVPFFDAYLAVEHRGNRVYPRHFVVSAALFAHAGGEKRLLSHPCFSKRELVADNRPRAYLYVLPDGEQSLSALDEESVYTMEVTPEALSHLSTFGAWMTGTRAELNRKLADGMRPEAVFRHYEENRGDGLYYLKHSGEEGFADPMESDVLAAVRRRAGLAEYMQARFGAPPVKGAETVVPGETLSLL